MASFSQKSMEMTLTSSGGTPILDDIRWQTSALESTIPNWSYNGPYSKKWYWSHEIHNEERNSMELEGTTQDDSNQTQWNSKEHVAHKQRHS